MDALPSQCARTEALQTQNAALRAQASELEGSQILEANLTAATLLGMPRLALLGRKRMEELSHSLVLGQEEARRRFSRELSEEMEEAAMAHDAPTCGVLHTHLSSAFFRGRDAIRQHLLYEEQT